MKNIELTKKLKELQLPASGFNMLIIDNFYWGRGKDGEYSFGFESKNSLITSINQSTKHLKLHLNEKFEMNTNDNVEEKKMSLLILKTTNDDKLVDLFVNLSLLLTSDTDEQKLLKHFLLLKDLFANDKKTSLIELQGMYGELFVMYSLKKNYRIDISTYYQQFDRSKFDFSINQNKKIEIKSTLKPTRIHHFLQQQLDVDRYDIHIISLMMQKDDCGMSLFELIQKCKDIFSNNLNLIFHIENMVKNINEDELENIKFNYDYSEESMKHFCATDLPKINEKNIEGVFNIEYDVDFSNLTDMTIESLANWIEE